MYAFYLFTAKIESQIKLLFAIFKAMIKAMIDLRRCNW